MSFSKKKKMIKSNFILSHSSQFWDEWKFAILREYREMSVPFYQFYSLLPIPFSLT